MSRTFKHVPVYVAFPGEVESLTARRAKYTDIRAEDTLADLPARPRCYRSRIRKSYSAFSENLNEVSFGQFSVVGAFWIHFDTEKFLSRNEASATIHNGSFVVSNSVSYFYSDTPDLMYKIGSKLELVLSDSYDEFDYAHILNAASAELRKNITDKDFYQDLPRVFYFEHGGKSFCAMTVATGAYAIINGPTPDFDKVFEDKKQDLLDGTSKGWRNRTALDVEIDKHYSSHYCCDWCSKSQAAEERGAVSRQLKDAVKAFNSGFDDYDLDL